MATDMDETPSMFSAEPESPGDALRRFLSERQWTQDELAAITGRTRPAINEIMSGRRGVTAEMAVALATAFGTAPGYWLQLDAAYRLAHVDTGEAEGIRQRARLYDLAPVKDMQRRGWISSDSKSLPDLERELKKFFGVESLEVEPRIGAATRKSDIGEPLTPSQRAWCFRVRQLAHAQVVSEYREDRLSQCAEELRKIAAHPQEAYKVPEALAKYGIRFAAVEPLPSSRVDGVAIWLDSSSPVIGMSLRYDRVDSFWFTLFHELTHLKYRDEAPLDGDLTDTMASVLVVPTDIERRANEEAAASLVPKTEMDSFVLRVGPLYSKDRIIRFANRIKIHPGIVVGQLQRRKEIGYSANREMLAKIRHFITPAAVTDGWGSSIDPRSFK
jgi:HTH-type transcriptional regulator/antitoxin HigA